MIFDDPPWLIEPKGWKRATAPPSPLLPDSVISHVLALEARNARRRSPATGTAKMIEGKNPGRIIGDEVHAKAAQEVKPHAEATSALRTYAITKRREADKLDEEVRRYALQISKMAAQAEAARLEAKAYEEAAAQLENPFRVIFDVDKIAISDPAPLARRADDIGR